MLQSLWLCTNAGPLLYYKQPYTIAPACNNTWCYIVSRIEHSYLLQDCYYFVMIEIIYFRLYVVLMWQNLHDLLRSAVWIRDRYLSQNTVISSFFIFFFIQVAYRHKLNILASTPPTADCNSTAHARLQLRPLGADKQLFYTKQTLILDTAGFQKHYKAMSGCNRTPMKR